MTRRAIALAFALAGALTACGGDGGNTAASSSVAPSASPLVCPTTAVEVEPPPGASTDLATKPVIAPATAAPPTDLQYADLVVGTGAEAVTDSEVEVKYVGAIYETGEEFDSSWSRGPDETLGFSICRPEVITGFSVGPSGMKVGGRRQITIPSKFGYEEEGQPPKIPPNATLVFVIDLVQVG